ncbi:MAG: hypothetical protein IKL52_02560 [Candidatus Gastranaerophilales bacterium]|nr:hypothetical protein [Candidatus Gastranaerophilales bacterium]
MINLLDEKENKNIQNKLAFEEILKFYSNDKKDFLIGLEYERLSLDKNTFKNTEYEKIEKIITHFASTLNWELIYDDKTIIGAKSGDGSSISLEPGCQLEISLAPKKDILSIELELNKLTNLLDKIASFYDVIFLGYGISPVSRPDEIKLLDKKRYQVMNNYLPSCQYGELIPKMMRQSAGMQVNIDYKNENDAFLKLKLFNLISPFMTALFANSPLENNTLTDKKTIRAHVWRFCGKNRCNLFYKNVFEGLFAHKNIFKNYIRNILEVPMIFIERENKIIEINGKITFREFLKNGFDGYLATYNDYILHQSLCFPDVRLKKYIEIRNHDSSDIKTALSLCALYKGICQGNIKKLLSKIDFLKINNIDLYSENIVTQGLDIEINSKIKGWDVIAILFNFAKENLNSKERSYLEPILSMLKTRKTKADIIMDYEIKKAKDLVEFLY